MSISRRWLQAFIQQVTTLEHGTDLPPPSHKNLCLLNVVPVYEVKEEDGLWNLMEDTEEEELLREYAKLCGLDGNGCS